MDRHVLYGRKQSKIMNASNRNKDEHDCEHHGTDTDADTQVSTDMNTANNNYQSCHPKKLQLFKLNFRPLQPSDREEIQVLHEEWFPVRYGSAFYDAIVENKLDNQNNTNSNHNTNNRQQGVDGDGDGDDVDVDIDIDVDINTMGDDENDVSDVSQNSDNGGSHDNAAKQGTNIAFDCDEDAEAEPVTTRHSSRSSNSSRSSSIQCIYNRIHNTNNINTQPRQVRLPSSPIPSPRPLPSALRNGNANANCNNNSRMNMHRNKHNYLSASQLGNTHTPSSTQSRSRQPMDLFTCVAILPRQRKVQQHQQQSPVSQQQQQQHGQVEEIRSMQHTPLHQPQQPPNHPDQDDNISIAGCVICCMNHVSLFGRNSNGSNNGDPFHTRTLGNQLVERSADHPHLCYIMTLGVRDEFRGDGLGSALIEKAVQHASAFCGNTGDTTGSERNTRKPTCGVIYLHVITHNHAAIRFYTRLGFIYVDTLLNYYTIAGRNYNCYVYAKFLNGNHQQRYQRQMLANNFKMSIQTSCQALSAKTYHCVYQSYAWWRVRLVTVSSPVWSIVKQYLWRQPLVSSEGVGVQHTDTETMAMLQQQPQQHHFHTRAEESKHV
jgi:ribosomal protein S18 acetylase RimI-like enzyme